MAKIIHTSSKIVLTPDDEAHLQVIAAKYGWDEIKDIHIYTPVEQPPLPPEVAAWAESEIVRRAPPPLLTVALSAEDYALLEGFAAEQGIEPIEQAIPAMIHELARLYDERWERSFAESTDVLAEMASKAAKDHRAGLTEDLLTD